VFESGTQLQRSVSSGRATQLWWMLAARDSFRMCQMGAFTPLAMGTDDLSAHMSGASPGQVRLFVPVLVDV
jgi:hypothetical protein